MGRLVSWDPAIRTEFLVNDGLFDERHQVFGSVRAFAKCPLLAAVSLFSIQRLMNVHLITRPREVSRAEVWTDQAGRFEEPRC